MLRENVLYFIKTVTPRVMLFIPFTVTTVNDIHTSPKLG